jgi:hypothetical protein
MNNIINRRDFLKLSGVGLAGLGALALNPRRAFDYSYFSIPKKLPSNHTLVNLRLSQL